jgi:hypothetical protein
MRAFNRWYDSLKEPKRFLVAMGLCIPAITLASSDLFPIGIRLFGLGVLCLLLLVRLIGR